MKSKNDGLLTTRKAENTVQREKRERQTENKN
jgi:hypothetical protein